MLTYNSISMNSFALSPKLGKEKDNEMKERMFAPMHGVTSGSAL